MHFTIFRVWKQCPERKLKMYERKVFAPAKHFWCQTEEIRAQIDLHVIALLCSTADQKAAVQCNNKAG